MHAIEYISHIEHTHTPNSPLLPPPLVSFLCPPPLPLQAGSPGCNALATVMASDARLIALQQEAEVLEEDAEVPSTGAAHDATGEGTPRLPGPREGGGDSESSPHPPVPPPSSSPLASMAALRQEIAELSLEEKVERLEEVYEGLDVLVRCR